jgi:hypothetical protein
MTMQGYVLSVERTIPAPPGTIFEILSDATKHSMIDGSGMLQGKSPDAPQRLALGTMFGMSMKMARVLAGRIWRYELEPVDGGTLVRESWDITPDHQRVLLKLGGIYSGKTRRDMTRTLERLDQLVTVGGDVGSPPA